MNAVVYKKVCSKDDTQKRKIQRSVSEGRIAFWHMSERRG